MKDKSIMEEVLESARSLRFDKVTILELKAVTYLHVLEALAI